MGRGKKEGIHPDFVEIGVDGAIKKPRQARGLAVAFIRL